MKEEIKKLYLTGLWPRKIANKLDITYGEVMSCLESLVKEEVLAVSRSGEYKEVKEGTLILKPEGFGFITVEDEELDYFVPVGCSLNAVNGDKVKFFSFSEGRKLKNAEVIRVTQRNTKYVCGKVIYKKRKKNLKSYVLTKLEGELHMLRLDDPNEYSEGTIVKVEILYKPHQITCKVVEVLGNENDKGIEITEVAANYGFKMEFSDETYKELELLNDEVEEKYLEDRIDYTDKTIITIDGDDAKDFDDAISLEVLPNGNYLLGVYIADVSNYVTPNSSLNEDALKRGTSVYLADRVIPMLPFKLSNGLCSLNEGVIRLVMACIMEINHEGEIVNHQINEGYIKSSHRMTYNNVNKILNKDPILCEKYKDIELMLNQMNDLALILRNVRHQKGGLDFEIDEYKVELNAKGEPVDIVLRERADAEKLIEDFMLAANNTVAYHLTNLNLPCVYRVHETPDQEKLREVFKVVKNMDVKVKLPKNEIHSKLIQKTLEDLEGNSLKPIINQMILRSMMKARYTTKNLGHYGLCMDNYCHFTSPIRRYPDLIVHRIIKELIIHPNNFEMCYNYYDNKLEEIAIMNSNSERKAIECEREVDDMMMAWYMSNHLKEHFKGIIISIMNFGMFIALENGAEGMINIRNMDGYFDFDDKNKVLSCGDRVYKLGDKVDVIVMYASKQNGKIELMLEEDYDSYFGVDDLWS